MFKPFGKAPNWLVAFFAILVLLCLLLWLALGTNQGNRWLFKLADQAIPGSLQTDDIQGHLLDVLEIQQLRYQDETQNLHIGYLKVHWRWQSLFKQSLHINELKIDDIRLISTAKELRDEEVKAEQTAIEMPIDLLIDDLQITNVQIQTDNEKAQQIEKITAKLAIVDQILTAADIQVHSDALSASLAGSSRLDYPHASQFELNWSLSIPKMPVVAGHTLLNGDVEQLKIQHVASEGPVIRLDAQLNNLLKQPVWDLRLTWDQLKLPFEQSTEQLLSLSNGMLSSQGGLDDFQVVLDLDHQYQDLPNKHLKMVLKGNQQQLQLTQLSTQIADVPVNAKGNLTLQEPLIADLSIDLPDNGSQIRLNASVANSAAKPQLDASVNWSDIQWPLTGQNVQLSAQKGYLSLVGTEDSYTLKLNTDLSSPPLASSQWSVLAQGDLAQLNIQHIKAQLLDGEFLADGKVAWAPELSAKINLNARDLMPTSILPEWHPDQRLNLDSRVSFDNDKLKLEATTARINNSETVVNLNGTMTTTPSPIFDFKSDWQQLQWPLDGNPEVSSDAGALQLQGSFDHFKLLLDAQLMGSNIPPAQWQLSGNGNTELFNLEYLRSDLLDGQLLLTGNLGMPAQNPRWDLSLTGSNLKPQLHWPEIPGLVDIDTKLAGHIDSEGRLDTKVSIEQITGKLFHQALDIQGDLALSDQQTLINRLDVKLGKNTLTAKGNINTETISATWDINAANINQVYPLATGAITAKGELSGTLEKPNLIANIDAQRLAIDDISVAKIKGKVNIGLEATRKNALVLDVKSLTLAEGSSIDELKLTGTGSMTQHQLNLTAKTRGHQLALDLDGQYLIDIAQWSGTIEKLTTTPLKKASWNLTKPVPVKVSANSAQISNLCLQQKSTSICTQASWLIDQGSQLKAQITELALSQFHPDISGTVNADINAQLTKDGLLTTNNQLTVSPGEIRINDQDNQQLAHQGGHVSINSSETGLQILSHFSLSDKNTLDANIMLPGLKQLPLSAGQNIDGEIRGDIANINFFAPFIPGIQKSAGQITLDLRIDGPVDKPRLDGKITLADAFIELPDAGITLEKMRFNAVTDAEMPEVWNFEAAMQSGNGHLEISGKGNLLNKSVAFNVNGEQFQVVKLPEYSAFISPALDIKLAPNSIWARGDLTIPEAHISPNISISNTLLSTNDTPGNAINPSNDVVFVEEPVAEVKRKKLETSTLLDIDSQINLLLGDAITVDAAGFKSHLGGKLLLTHLPQKHDLIPLADGELRIYDGTFRSFGQDLENKNGFIRYDNAPLTEPNLDIEGVRQIRNDDRVRHVGIQVLGTPDKLQLKPFSDPFLPDDQIMAYLLTGKSLDNEELTLSVGTYVHPKIYVGYGHEIVSSTNNFNIRYDITRSYGIETNISERDNVVTFTYILEK